MEKNSQFAKTVRWSARILGTTIVTGTLIFALGYLWEGAHKSTSTTAFNPSLVITFIFWGLGLAGLILALWNEKKGGIISLFSFIIFISLAAIKSHPDYKFFVLLIFLIPSLLYLAYWKMTSKTLPK